MSQLLQFYKSFQQSRAPVTKSAPTFEDLTIDDNLTEQQRVVRYVKSTIGLQRLVHVKMMADVAISVGFDQTVQTIVPLIAPLSKDSEPVVKQHLVEQLRYLAKFCCEEGGEEGYKVVLDRILPITAQLLEDEKAEVRQSASLTLVEVAQLVRNEDIGQHVLTIILRLAHEDDKEEMRMTASQLLNLLAECLGQDLCKQFVIPEVVSLAEDPVFRVRKSTALNFHNICKVGGEFELLERLMPAFVRLSKDDMYRVRRACAESLSEIAKNVSEDIRLGVLVEIFLRLTHDPSKLVKQSILQQSGVFIAALPSRAVNETILNQYCSMVSAPTGDISVDNELRHICAYSFPAVLQVVGPTRWPEVREVYHSLAQSRSVNIKQTLAYSLHEIARILDDGLLVEEELVPVFEDMLQDVEAVQMGVIKYLAKFLAKLPEPCRVSYLPLLHDILHSTNPFNWRLRQHLARQLSALVLLPPKTDIYRTLFPTVMILLQDPVASVRRDTFEGVTALINDLNELANAQEHCGNDGEGGGEGGDKSNAELVEMYRQNVEDVVKAINSFAVAEKFQLRQLWLDLCAQLLRDLPRKFFEDNFIEGILLLTTDPVCNVRVALSFFLVAWGPDYLPPWELPNEDGSTRQAPAGIALEETVPPGSKHGTAEKQTLPNGNATTTVTAAADAGKADGDSNSEAAAAAPTSARTISPWHWLLRRTDIRQCVQRLAQDDNDVYLNLQQLRALYPDVAFSSMSCRGRKTPPGGINPIELNPTPISESLTSQNIALRGLSGQRVPKIVGGSSMMSTHDSSSQLSAMDSEAQEGQDVSSTMPEEHLRIDSASSIASSSYGGAGGGGGGGASAGGADESFSSPQSSVKSRSRQGSIATSDIHLDIDISPVEIDSSSNPPPLPPIGSPAASFHLSADSVQIVDLKDLKNVSPVASGIVADEVDLMEGFPGCPGELARDPLLPPTEPISAGINADPLATKSVDDDKEDSLVDEEADSVPYKEPAEAAAEFQDFIAHSDLSDSGSVDGERVRSRAASEASLKDLCASAASAEISDDSSSGGKSKSKSQGPVEEADAVVDGSSGSDGSSVGMCLEDGPPSAEKPPLTHDSAVPDGNVDEQNEEDVEVKSPDSAAGAVAAPTIEEDGVKDDDIAAGAASAET